MFKIRVTTTPSLNWALIICSDILFFLEKLNDYMNTAPSTAYSGPKPQTLFTLTQWNTTNLMDAQGEKNMFALPSKSKILMLNTTD